MRLHHALRAASNYNQGPYWSLSFNGVDDYVSASNPGSLYPNNAITVEAWLKADTRKSGYQHVVGKDTNVILKFEQSGSNYPRFQLNNGESWYTAEYTTALSTNVWVHMAGTYDGSQMVLYIDGSVAVTVSSSFTMNFNNNDLYIGGYNNTNIDFDGTISDVRIWNIARTQQEIQDNMNNQLTGNEAGLVAYYPMKAGSGTTLYDYAGTNNGTIYGATWVEL